MCFNYNNTQNKSQLQTVFNGLDDVIRNPTVKDCESLEKTLDVFISYRRSNGSQLASLIATKLEIRKFSVFLDVEG